MKFPKLNKRFYYILVLLIINAVILFFSYIYSNSKFMDYDEAVYLLLARQLSENPLFYLQGVGDIKWNDWHELSPYPYSYPNIGKRDFFSYFLLLFIKAKVINLFPFFNAFLYLLSVFLIYVITLKLTDNERASFLASIMFSLNWITIPLLFSYLTDILSLFLILLSVLFLTLHIRSKKPHFLVLFSLFFSLSILIRYATLVLLFPFVLSLLFYNKDNLKKYLISNSFWIASSAILFFLVLTPLFYLGLKFYSHPLGTFIHSLEMGKYSDLPEKIREYPPVASNILFYFSYCPICSFITLSLFLVALIDHHKGNKKSYDFFLLSWFFIGVFFLLLSPHMACRYFLPLFPAPFIYFASRRKAIVPLIISLIVIMVSGLIVEYYIIRDMHHPCIYAALDYISQHSSKNTYVYTSISPIVTYLTNVSSSSLFLIKEDRSPSHLLVLSKANYIFSEEDVKRMGNYELIFYCDSENDFSRIYRG